MDNLVAPLSLYVIEVRESQVRESHNIWNEKPTSHFLVKMRKCIKFYRMFCIKKAAEGRQEELSLRESLEAKTSLIHRDPDSARVQEELEQARSKLRNLEEHKVCGQQLRSRVKWLNVGDKCSKEFFGVHNQRTNAAHIVELEDIHGNLQRDQGTMVGICHSYYQSLYKARPIPEAAEGAEHHILRHITNRVSIEAKTSLQAPITQEELGEAMRAMALGKSPRPDGVILEFYRT